MEINMGNLIEVKISDLNGPALDWAVAKGEDDAEIEIQDGVCVWFEDDYKLWSPSTNWSQGGPIIEREFIELVTTTRNNEELWEAMGRGFGEDSPIAYGPTPLIAAMRCHVTSKLGETVMVPAKLITT